MDKCAVCGKTEDIYYYYPVGSIIQGYVLCKEHGAMAELNDASLKQLLALLVQAKKKGGTANVMAGRK